MANPNRRGPRALSEILGELFTARGYGRLQALGELERAWNSAVGEPHCHETRVGELRRGVLSVTVAHPTLLQELAAFRKAEILQALRASTIGTAIEDIRFRIGPVSQSGPEAETAQSLPGEQGVEKGKSRPSTKRRVRARHTRLGEQNRGKTGHENAEPGS
jgi:predicted nucleic acid-binding Zn ribbon protein